MTPSDETLFISVHLDAASSLDAINASVALYEEILGALTMMRIDNDTTLLRFSTKPPKPQPFAIIAPQVGGKPDIPTGATLVASGQILISGNPTLCAATRGS